MITAEQVADSIKAFSAEVSKAAEADFEKVWAEAEKKPEMQQVAFMKKIFGLFYTEGFHSGACEAATKIFEHRTNNG